MLDLLDLQKEFILRHLNEGDIAADFTMGNGHDTEFLARSVGESGHVYSFDIQERALESTSDLLIKRGLIDRVTLICDSHHNAEKYIKCGIKAGMFNLGYLPGGEHIVTTKRETTLPAVEFALSALLPDGILLVAVYPGHAEGTAEGEMLEEYFSNLNRFVYCATKIKIINSPASPFFFIIERGNK